MAGKFLKISQCQSSGIPSLFELRQPTIMAVRLFPQILDVLLHLGGFLKGLRDLGRDKEVDKYGGDGGMTFDLVFEDIRHHLMALKGGPHHCGSIISG